MASHFIARLPEHMGPVSRMLLQKWLSGSMTTTEFLAWFHMPHSDYLPSTPSLLGSIERGSGNIDLGSEKSDLI